MKKKILAAGIILLVLTVCLTALAANEGVREAVKETAERLFEAASEAALETASENATLSEEGSEAEAVSENVSEADGLRDSISTETALFSADMLGDAVKEIGKFAETGDFTNEEINHLKSRLILTAVEYKMTASETEKMKELISLNYDVDILCDIYAFLRKTSSGIDMVEDIYIEGEKYMEDAFWIYDAYDRLLGREDDMLTVEDVAYYAGSGITIDEILGAYDLSFMNVKSTKQMLDERLTGESWNSIAAEIVAPGYEAFALADEMEIGEILEMREAAIMQREPLKNVIEIDGNKATLCESADERWDSIIREADELADLYNMGKITIRSEDKLESRREAFKSMGKKPEVYSTDEDEDDIPVEEPEVE